MIIKKIIVTLCLFLPVGLKAQAISKVDIIGTWIATDGKTARTDLPADVKPMMAQILGGFKKSTWTFNENGTFRIKFNAKSSSPLMEEMHVLDKKRWVFINPDQIRIGLKEDNYNHLVLITRRLDSGMRVYFSDIPIYLTLKKEPTARN